MEDYAEFQYLEKPREFSIEDIEGAHLEAFVVTGIVNPFGPTLSFVATVGRSAHRPLIYAMLNPFSCEVKQIGTYVEGEKWCPDEEFVTLSQFLSGSCPTIILTHSALDAETRSRVTEHVIGHFDDAETVLEGVRGFFGNPMDRVGRAVGANVPDPPTPASDIQLAKWSDLVSDARHVWPEIHAFRYAWEGSINKTGISDNMKYNALTAERMKAILLPMLQSVWMPEPEASDSPPAKKLDRPLPEPESLDQIRQMLMDDSHWRDLSGDQLLQFMEWSLLLYGREMDGDLVPYLMSLYEHVTIRTDPEHRKLYLQRISSAAEKNGLAACTMLPPLLCDEDKLVVSTAMIDYIALCHPGPGGLPYEFSDLNGFFNKGTFSCPGGAMGGLITLGDRRFHPQMNEWKKFLDKDAVRDATNCRTPFITHGEIVFWLDWADQLVGLRDYASEEIFGLVASAVGLLGKHNPYEIVQDTERRYPGGTVEKTVVILRTWDRSQYAQEIAPRLYHLEDTEAAPKVFSAVLRAWGLEPRADLMDQFIPED